MEDEKRARIHPWIYVIIPIEGKPVFSAFCKACRQYFSEVVPFDWNEAVFSPSTLPRYGCEPISEEVTLLP